MQKIKKLDLNLNVITKGDRCLEWAGGGVKFSKSGKMGGVFKCSRICLEGGGVNL